MNMKYLQKAVASVLAVALGGRTCVLLGHSD